MHKPLIPICDFRGTDLHFEILKYFRSSIDKKVFHFSVWSLRHLFACFTKHQCGKRWETSGSWRADVTELVYHSEQFIWHVWGLSKEMWCAGWETVTVWCLKHDWTLDLWHCQCLCWQPAYREKSQTLPGSTASSWIPKSLMSLLRAYFLHSKYGLSFFAELLYSPKW